MASMLITYSTLALLLLTAVDSPAEQEFSGTAARQPIEDDEFPNDTDDWPSLIADGIRETADGRLEVRNFRFFRALATGNIVEALCSIDKTLDEKVGSMSANTQSYSAEKLRKRVLDKHPAIPLLRDLQKRLASAEATYELQGGLFQYVKGVFWLHMITDDSNRSADRLALGIVDGPGGASGLQDDGSTFLTIGAWKRFGCWEEPEFAHFVNVYCGIRLNGMPTSVANLIEDGNLKARLRWHGVSGTIKAHTCLIRGMGYEKVRVMVASKPSVDLIGPNGESLWTAK